MGRKTRELSLCAMLTACAAILLLLSSVSPSGQLGFVAAASILPAAAVIECGFGAGFSVFAASSILGALIMPDKRLLFLYIVFFGYYPVIKSVFERSKNRALEWIAKFLVFNVALTVTWFLLKGIMFGSVKLPIGVELAYILGNLTFVAFDIGLTKLISFYIARISRNK